MLTDSLSALQAMNNFHYTYSHEFIRELLNFMERIERTGAAVVFAWVHGHVAIHGNEEADKLARNASLARQSPSLDSPISKTGVKIILKITA